MYHRLLILSCFVFLFSGCSSEEQLLNKPDKNPNLVVVSKIDGRQDVPSSCISLHGWAKEFMQRQESGLTGHPEESGFPFNTKMWTESMNFKDREFPGGSGWWPYEQTAYYLDGALRCGYINNSDSLLLRPKANIDFVLSNADSTGQLSAGNIEDDWWPMVVFVRLLMEEYKNTGNKAILSALEKHYRSVYSKEESFNLPKGAGFSIRALLHIEHLCNLSLLTGNNWYLKIAEDLYSKFNQNAIESNSKQAKLLTAKGMANGLVPHGHGVTYHEFLKLPAVLYRSTGKEIYRKAIDSAFVALSVNHELSSGLSSSIEELAGKSPDLAHEVCNVSDFNWACGWALLATGEAKYADKMEKVFYNAGLSSVTSDFKAHQYYSAPNMPISSDLSSFYNDNTNWGFSAKGRLCYRPGHDTECCSGNIHRMFPTFLNRMYLIEPNAVSLALYVPSTLKIPFNGDLLEITQNTNYPFENSIEIVLNKVPSTNFTLKLRIPGWADSYNISLNGEKILNGDNNAVFVELNNSFNAGDKVNISFETSPKIDRTKNGMAINYGALVFSMPVPAKLRLTSNDDGAGKCSDKFPAYQLFPETRDNWAFALSQNLSASNIAVITNNSKGYPWDYNNSPIQLKVNARKVTNWKLKGLVANSVFPATPSINDEDKSLTLEPMGSTLLRITEFPVANF